MNILVTGATGLLSKKLITRLAKNHKVYALSRNSEGFEERDRISLIEMDLTNVKMNNLPSNIDAVYYLAQSKRFRESRGIEYA
jgi:nucleoside-diphosphate-sugar epimerase